MAVQQQQQQQQQILMGQNHQQVAAEDGRSGLGLPTCSYGQQHRVDGQMHNIVLPRHMQAPQPSAFQQQRIQAHHRQQQAQQPSAFQQQPRTVQPSTFQRQQQQQRIQAHRLQQQRQPRTAQQHHSRPPRAVSPVPPASQANDSRDNSTSPVPTANRSRGPRDVSTSPVPTANRSRGPRDVSTSPVPTANRPGGSRDNSTSPVPTANQPGGPRDVSISPVPNREHERHQDRQQQQAQQQRRPATSPNEHLHPRQRWVTSLSIDCGSSYDRSSSGSNSSSSSGSGGGGGANGRENPVPSLVITQHSSSGDPQGGEQQNQTARSPRGQVRSVSQRSPNKAALANKKGRRADETRPRASISTTEDMGASNQVTEAEEDPSADESVDDVVTIPTMNEDDSGIIVMEDNEDGCDDDKEEEGIAANDVDSSLTASAPPEDESRTRRTSTSEGRQRGGLKSKPKAEDSSANTNQNYHESTEASSAMEDASARASASPSDEAIALPNREDNSQQIQRRQDGELRRRKVILQGMHYKVAKAVDRRGYFANKVDERDDHAPGYYGTIGDGNEMYLSLMLERVKSGLIFSVEDYEAHLNQVVENCAKYNTNITNHVRVEGDKIMQRARAILDATKLAIDNSLGTDNVSDPSTSDDDELESRATREAAPVEGGRVEVLLENSWHKGTIKSIQSAASTMGVQSLLDITLDSGEERELVPCPSHTVRLILTTPQRGGSVATASTTPAEGGRVAVLFNVQSTGSTEWHKGTIKSVQSEDSSTGTKTFLAIKYDDGYEEEEIEYPDPDGEVRLIPSDSPDEKSPVKYTVNLRGSLSVVGGEVVLSGTWQSIGYAHSDLNTFELTKQGSRQVNGRGKYCGSFMVPAHAQPCKPQELNEVMNLQVDFVPTSNPREFGKKLLITGSGRNDVGKFTIEGEAEEDTEGGLCRHKFDCLKKKYNELRNRSSTSAIDESSDAIDESSDAIDESSEDDNDADESLWIFGGKKKLGIGGVRSVYYVTNKQKKQKWIAEMRVLLKLARFGIYTSEEEAQSALTYGRKELAKELRELTKEEWLKRHEAITKGVRKSCQDKVNGKATVPILSKGFVVKSNRHNVLLSIKMKDHKANSDSIATATRSHLGPELQILSSHGISVDPNLHCAGRSLGAASSLDNIAVAIGGSYVSSANDDDFKVLKDPSFNPRSQKRNGVTFDRSLMTAYLVLIPKFDLSQDKEGVMAIVNAIESRGCFLDHQLMSLPASVASSEASRDDYWALYDETCEAAAKRIAKVLDECPNLRMLFPKGKAAAVLYHLAIEYTKDPGSYKIKYSVHPQFVNQYSKRGGDAAVGVKGGISELDAVQYMQASAHELATMLGKKVPDLEKKEWLKLFDEAHKDQTQRTIDGYFEVDDAFDEENVNEEDANNDSKPFIYNYWGKAEDSPLIKGENVFEGWHIKEGSKLVTRTIFRSPTGLFFYGESKARKFQVDCERNLLEYRRRTGDTFSQMAIRS